MKCDVCGESYISKEDKALEIAKESLQMICENPTSDSTSIVSHDNNWTRWAKTRSKLALKQITAILK